MIPVGMTKNQKVLVYVTETYRKYHGFLLDATPEIQEEINEMGRDIEYHPGLKGNMPKQKGLYVWEGEMDFSDSDAVGYEGPRYVGNFRRMEQKDIDEVFTL